MFALSFSCFGEMRVASAYSLAVLAMASWVEALELSDASALMQSGLLQTALPTALPPVGLVNKTDGAAPGHHGKCPDDHGLVGYRFSHAGFLKDFKMPRQASSAATCAEECNNFLGCVSFSFRKRGRRTECFVYTGAYPKNDKFSVAYRRCAKHEDCPNDDSHDGFRFSHKGWWKDFIAKGVMKTTNHCADVCKKEDSCTAFSFRETPHSNGVTVTKKPECFIYTGNPAKADKWSSTYEKCSDMLSATSPPGPTAEGALSPQFGKRDSVRIIGKRPTGSTSD